MIQHQKHYNPTRPGGLDFARRGPAMIREALTAFGLEAPPRLNPVDLALEAAPTADTVAADLAMEALDVSAKGAEKWTREAAARLQAAEATDALREAMKKYLPNQTRARWKANLADALAQLADPVAEVLAELQADAANLPSTGDPLDPATVLAAGAGGVEHQRTTANLSRLSAAASLLLTSGLDEVAGPMLPLLDLPEVAREKIDAFTRVSHEDAPNPEREAVRRLRSDAAEHGLDHALIRVAQGAYGGVSLSLAPDLDTMRDRSQRLEDAVSRQRVSNGGQASGVSAVRVRSA